MFAILAFYPLARLGPVSTRAKRPVSAWILAGLFAFFQVYPSLVSRDRVLSGVGRTFALNMFEAKYDCNVSWIEHFRGEKAVTVNVKDKATERIECEPIYYYSKTRGRCRTLAADPEFVDLDFHMELRRQGDRGAMWPLIHQTSFCGKTPAFNLFLPNSWMEY